MVPAAGDPYFKLKAAGYVDAGKKLGYDVKIYDAGGYGNLQNQVTQIEDVIQRKVSGIVLVPASFDGTVVESVFEFDLELSRSRLPAAC
jgi:ABC-type sugar transport system substrate-binding protein